jgi:hypothetical protein
MSYCLKIKVTGEGMARPHSAVSLPWPGHRGAYQRPSWRVLACSIPEKFAAFATAESVAIFAS